VNAAQIKQNGWIVGHWMLGRLQAEIIFTWTELKGLIDQACHSFSVTGTERNKF